MERAQVLRLIAEGKTGKALDYLLDLNALNTACDPSVLERDDLKIILLSHNLRMAENAFLNNLIQYNEYTSHVNKVTIQLLDIICTRN